jgi:hypothetical protein
MDITNSIVVYRTSIDYKVENSKKTVFLMRHELECLAAV